MAICERCRGSIGFLDSGPKCKGCIEFLRTRLESFKNYLDRFTADHDFTEQEETWLRDFQLRQGLTDDDVKFHMPRIFRGRAMRSLRRGELSVVSAPFFMQQGEVAHLVMPSRLFEERTGHAISMQSSSVGFALTSRISIGGGSSLGAAIPVSMLTAIGDGSFCVTSQRCAFVGCKTIVVALRDLMSFHPFADAIRLDYAGKQTEQYFMVPDGEVAAMTLTLAMQRAR